MVEIQGGSPSGRCDAVVGRAPFAIPFDVPGLFNSGGDLALGVTFRGLLALEGCLCATGVTLRVAGGPAFAGVLAFVGDDLSVVFNAADEPLVRTGLVGGEAFWP
jgi:hypothetical protein